EKEAPKPTVDTVPTPEPEPTPEPVVEPEPKPTPEPVTEPEYYEVKETEKAIKETRAYFQSNSAWISAADREKFDKLATKMQSDSKYHAIIHGHTDNVGDPESNKKLARKRALKVKEYLIAQGVSEDKLTLVAEGAQNPIAENDTEEGREKNRRVEVLLLEDKDK
ncbi:MAG: OmpA family protein, partial [Aureispira sp.]|nr:OmpA family protein [Aureispira sp.]